MFAAQMAAALGGGTPPPWLRVAHCDGDKKDADAANKSFFDADALERGAKAVREIDRSTNAKAVRLCQRRRAFRVRRPVSHITSMPLLSSAGSPDCAVGVALQRRQEGARRPRGTSSAAPRGVCVSCHRLPSCPPIPVQNSISNCDLRAGCRTSFAKLCHPVPLHSLSKHPTSSLAVILLRVMGAYTKGS